MKVISGGQTGVDQAGLRAARACGIETGGWAPKRWLTEDGPAPWLADYGLVEHESSDYPPRTEANVRDSDGTLLIGNPWSSGSIATLKAIIKYPRPSMIISKKYAGQIVEIKTKARLSGPRSESFLVQEPDIFSIVILLMVSIRNTVNIAGNRESSNPGIGAAAEAFLTEVFRKWKEQAK